MRRGSMFKPLVRYRFKDDMGCVFYKAFNTDKEARLWFERNKVGYCLREFGSMGETYKARNLDCVDVI